MGCGASSETSPVSEHINNLSKKVKSNRDIFQGETKKFGVMEGLTQNLKVLYGRILHIEKYKCIC